MSPLGTWSSWFRSSGAFCNFCTMLSYCTLYSVFHLHYFHGIGECLMKKTIWMASLSVFISQWFPVWTYFYYYINIVLLHPAVWNTYILVFKHCTANSLNNCWTIALDLPFNNLSFHRPHRLILLPNPKLNTMSLPMLWAHPGTPV